MAEEGKRIPLASNGARNDRHPRYEILCTQYQAMCCVSFVGWLSTQVGFLVGKLISPGIHINAGVSLVERLFCCCLCSEPLCWIATVDFM